YTDAWARPPTPRPLGLSLEAGDEPGDEAEDDDRNERRPVEASHGREHAPDGTQDRLCRLVDEGSEAPAPVRVGPAQHDANEDEQREDRGQHRHEVRQDVAHRTRRISQRRGRPWAVTRALVRRAPYRSAPAWRPPRRRPRRPQSSPSTAPGAAHRARSRGRRAARASAETWLWPHPPRIQRARSSSARAHERGGGGESPRAARPARRTAPSNISGRSLSTYAP